MTDKYKSSNTIPITKATSIQEMLNNLGNSTETPRLNTVDTDGIKGNTSKSNLIDILAEEIATANEKRIKQREEDIALGILDDLGTFYVRK